MLSFKKWLKQEETQLHEAGFSDAGSDWFFGSYLYPSDAFDWQYVQAHPGDYYFLRSRWKMDREEGRKFINMDIDPIIKQHFTSIYSKTMPEGAEKPGFWKHRPDNRSNLTIDTDAKLHYISHGKDGNMPMKILQHNDLLDKKAELNKLFGQFTPKYPQEAQGDSWWINEKDRE